MNQQHQEDESRERLAYNTYRGGFSRNHPPLWQDLEPWVRDAITVAYLQGKLDRGHALSLQDHAPKESAPTPADLLAAAREAFLDLRADAQRWDEDVDGDTDSNGRTVVYVNYHATFGNRQLEDLCEALGIRVPFGETAGDAIDRVIADGAAAMVAEEQTEAKS